MTNRSAEQFFYMATFVLLFVFSGIAFAQHKYALCALIFGAGFIILCVRDYKYWTPKNPDPVKLKAFRAAQKKLRGLDGRTTTKTGK